MNLQKSKAVSKVLDGVMRLKKLWGSQKGFDGVKNRRVWQMLWVSKKRFWWSGEELSLANAVREFERFWWSDESEKAVRKFEKYLIRDEIDKARENWKVLWTDSKI